MNNVMAVLGARIREARRETSISVETLAEAVGVSKQALLNWETGRNRIEVDKLPALSNTLGRPIDWFFLSSNSTSERIRQAREEAGLSLQQLADALNLLVDEVAAWEEDKNAEPSVPQFRALGAVLGKPWFWFMEGELEDGVIASAERIQSKRGTFNTALSKEFKHVTSTSALDEAIEALEATLARLRSIRDAG